MIGNDCEGLDDIDTLQRSIKRIVQGYMLEIKKVRKNLSIKEAEINGLLKQNVQLTQQLKIFEEKSKNCTCRAISNVCLPTNYSQFEDFHDEVLKEVEDISTLELDSQFVSDSELQKEKIITSCPTTNILERLFPLNVDPNPYKELPLLPLNDIILADESPIRNRPEATNRLFVPETVPQNFNETTPRKLNYMGPTFSENESNLVMPVTENKPLNDDSPKSSPVIRLTPCDKLMPERKIPFNLSQLISPSRRLKNSPSKFNDTESPKRKLFSARQSKSPKRSRTPRKKVSSLKTSNRIEAELSYNGVRKLTQTQLNIACFKKFKSNENVPDASRTPVKDEPMDDLNCAGQTYLKPSTPLNSLENSPDPNETNLTSSAIRRVADDIVMDVKPVLTSSYDRIPEPISFEGRKGVRKRLPGLECPDCVKYYETFGNGKEDIRQKLLDRCSRHRTKNVDLNSTPEGFWKPMITQTPR